LLQYLEQLPHTELNQWTCCEGSNCTHGSIGSINHCNVLRGGRLVGGWGRIGCGKAGQSPARGRASLPPHVVPPRGAFACACLRAGGRGGGSTAIYFTSAAISYCCMTGSFALLPLVHSFLWAPEAEQPEDATRSVSNQDYLQGGIDRCLRSMKSIQYPLEEH